MGGNASDFTLDLAAFYVCNKNQTLFYASTTTAGDKVKRQADRATTGIICSTVNPAFMPGKGVCDREWQQKKPLRKRK